MVLLPVIYLTEPLKVLILCVTDGKYLACFYGPESTGKTGLARKLAADFRTEYVPEVAREFIQTNEFTTDDILRIGREQVARTLEKLKTARKVLICDTDLITTQIYSRQYLGTVPDELFVLEKKVRYDQYFFFDIDVPWVADGLRNLGKKRGDMKVKFLSELQNRNIDFMWVQGSWEAREALARKKLASWFSEWL